MRAVLFALLDDGGRSGPLVERRAARSTAQPHFLEGPVQDGRTSHPSRVTIKLDFIKPFEGHNIAEFGLAPQGDSTNVTWTMDGPSPYLGKLIGVFLNMDTMIGKDFEAGLASLKAIAEE